MNKVAICVGHSRSGDNGAVSIEGESEWNYNGDVARITQEMLLESGFEAKVWDRYEGASYGAAMSWIAAEIRSFGADVALELHFNAAGPSAEGYEYLYWSTSDDGKRLAGDLVNSQSGLVPSARPRGAKGKFAGDRGSQFLRKTHCPAAITEPFFGTNWDEWERYGENHELVARINASAIRRFFA